MDSILDMMTGYALAGYIKEKCQETEKNLNSLLGEYGIIGKITIECQIDGIDTETFLQKAKKGETVIVEAKVPIEQDEKIDEHFRIDNFYKEKNDDD